MAAMKIRQIQSGYALVFFLGFIAAICLAAFSLYDNGTVAAERIKMQNTADATAYSTVNVISRDMNFLAYTNRAMVANQVAIGQMVGLSSWMRMIDQFTYNVDKVAQITRIIPPVGAVVTSITKAINKAAKIGKKLVDNGATVGITATEIILTTLSGSQDAFQIAVGDMVESTYRKVSKANDEDISNSMILKGVGFASLIESSKSELEQNVDPRKKGGGKRATTRDNFRDFAKVVRSSRDPFSENRSYYWIGWTGADVGIAEAKGSVQKKGGSDLIEKTSLGRLYWDWTAMDTVSIWTKWKLGFGWFSISYNGEDVPVSWGAGHALTGSSKYYNYKNQKSSKQTFYNDGKVTDSKKWLHWGDGAFKNGMAASIAAKDDGKNRRAKIEGLRPFYSLQRKVKKDSGPSMVAIISKDLSEIAVQQTLDSKNDKYNRVDELKIESEGSVRKNTLYALAKAETYFSRPSDLWPRGDGYREYGNLYNPFWQTRLIEASTKERAGAMLLAQGL